MCANKRLRNHAAFLRLQNRKNFYRLLRPNNDFLFSKPKLFMKMKMRLIALSLLFFISAISSKSFAQQRISGSIKSSGINEPLAGASIKSSSGANTTADSSGNFNIAAAPGDILHISYVG